MHNIPRPPTDVHVYFDTIAIWLKRPVRTRTIDELRQNYGHVHVGNHKARFGGGYRQRIEMKQPSDEALRWIAGRDDALVNVLHPAVDYAFDSADELEATEQFFNKHLVRRWRRRSEHIRIVHDTTRYDASGKSRNKIVSYADRYSRITGELHCLHLEWRARGADAVRRAGVRTAQDLVGFNHRRFWRKRLLLVDADPEKLGRAWRNRRTGGRSRTAMMHELNNRRVNADHRTGNTMMNGYNSLQELIAEHPGMKRVLTEISNTRWLPRREGGNSNIVSREQGIAREWSGLVGESLEYNVARKEARDGEEDEGRYADGSIG